MGSIQRFTKRLGAPASVLAIVTAIVAVGGVAEAANGASMILGQVNEATVQTQLYTTGGNGLYVSSDGSGVVALGTGDDDFGVQGIGDTGVSGSGYTYGLTGFSDNGTGIWGRTHDETTAGVYGENDASTNSGGSGVVGVAPHNIGVSAISSHGTALAVSGVASFSRSGRVIVPAGVTKVIVKNVALSGGSMVLATLQAANPGVKGVVPHPGTSSLTIYLTKAASKQVAVAWFVLN